MKTHKVEKGYTLKAIPKKIIHEARFRRDILLIEINSNRKRIFVRIKSESSRLKFKTKLHTLLLKENFKELTDIQYTNESTATLAQLALVGPINGTSMVVTKQQAKNIDQIIVVLKTNGGTQLLQDFKQFINKIFSKVFVKFKLLFYDCK